MIKMELMRSKELIDQIENSAKRGAAQAQADVALQVYNEIVMGTAGVDFPYYSGSYIASWTISKGLPKFTHKPIPSPYKKNVYDQPQEILSLGDLQWGASVYISNNAPHADQVETEGTPSRDSGWKVAEHAKNKVKMTYKFKFRP